MSEPLIGLDMFHYAIVTGDDENGTTYGEPVRIINPVSLSINMNTDVATFFADDGPAVAYSQIGEVDVAIELADMPTEHLAALIGADYDAASGVMRYDTEAIAPNVAVGFRAQKSNGHFRYVWLYKGKFGIPNMEHQTKEASVSFQTQTLNGKFLSRIYDRLVFARVDSDADSPMPGLPDAWFVDPNLGAVPSPDPLAVESVGETAEVITWNFTGDRALNLSFVSPTYFRIYSLGDNEYVDSADLTVAYPAAGEVTVTHDGAYTPGDYLAVAVAGLRAADGGLLANSYYFPFTIS